jgi:hypothetical protein
MNMKQTTRTASACGRTQDCTGEEVIFEPVSPLPLALAEKYTQPIKDK